ncbi:AfsA-related hotdog domain-containing protein [Pseudomonas sp. RC10]|uniref:AfsA-related hotdog domain-containing protein n=1 Tax=Pseudomonas bambusae TaxID=3139142 RepID=UPI003139752D
MRHLLPAWLPLNVLQQAADLPAAREALDEAYRIESERLVLRTLPDFIGQEHADSTELAEQLQYLYEPCFQGLKLKSQWVLEHIQAQLCVLTDRPSMPDIPSRQRLHESLKALAGYPQGGPLYFTMFNDTSNYFFYRKHHEHVPGMMLIEVARQAMYAEFYQHSGFARGEVSISILDLTSRFSRFTESSYQVDLVVSDNGAPMEHKPRKVDKRAQLFQNAAQVADIHLYGEIIKMPVFKRIRNISIDPDHWFRPLKGIRKEVLVRLACGRHLTGEMVLLSMNSLQILCAARAGTPAQSVNGHIYLYLESDGLMSLPVTSIQDVEGQDTTLHLALGELNSSLRFNWREVLKQYSYFSHSKTEHSNSGVNLFHRAYTAPRTQA